MKGGSELSEKAEEKKKVAFTVDKKKDLLDKIELVLKDTGMNIPQGTTLEELESQIDEYLDQETEN